MPLSSTFLNDLLNGHLQALLGFLSADATLCPEIRNDTLSIYYRGGCLLKCQRLGNSYSPSFDDKYRVESNCGVDCSTAWWDRIASRPATLDGSDAVAVWLDIIPLLKAVMDRWFARHGGLEGEYQQLLARENNHGGSSDYFICDTERVENFSQDGNSFRVRFDFLAAHWPSRGHVRKVGSNRGFVLGEMKHGDGAVTGSQGIVSHLDHLRCFLSDPSRLMRLKDAMKDVFNQKRLLGFIKNQNDIISFETDQAPPVWLLVLANHDPESSVLLSELRKLPQLLDFPLRVRIAVSNFMGYGLYDQNVYDLDQFLSKFADSIYSGPNAVPQVPG